VTITITNGTSGLTPLSATTGCPDPGRAYQKLRDEWGNVAPVELEPGVGAWLLLSYADILTVARHERMFSRDPHNWRAWQDKTVAPDSGLGPMMFPRDNAYDRTGWSTRASTTRTRCPCRSSAS
jgi:cytochrome P450